MGFTLSGGNCLNWVAIPSFPCLILNPVASLCCSFTLDEDMPAGPDRHEFELMDFSGRFFAVFWPNHQR